MRTCNTTDATTAETVLEGHQGIQCLPVIHLKLVDGEVVREFLALTPIGKDPLAARLDEMFAHEPLREIGRIRASLQPLQYILAAGMRVDTLVAVESFRALRRPPAPLARPDRSAKTPCS